MTIDISRYSKQELSSLARWLKLFRILKKQVGGIAARVWKGRGGVLCRVQYGGAFTPEDQYTYIQSLFLKHFSHTPEKDAIIWEKNNHLLGGVRLFFGDDLVDISFSHTEKKMMQSLIH